MSDELIARSRQSLHEHLVGVATLAEGFAQVFELPNAGRLIGSAHDEGKASSVFQCYIRSATGLFNPEDEEYVDAAGLKGKIDHSTAGAQKLWQGFKRTATQAQDVLFAQMLALCICSHHSGLIDCLNPDGERIFNKRMDKPADKTHLEELYSVFGEGYGSPEQQILPDVLREMRERFAPILTPKPSERCAACRLRDPKVCRVHNPLAWFSLGLMTRMLFSCLLDADRTESADAEHPDNASLRTSGAAPWLKLVNRLEQTFSNFTGTRSIDAIRRRISEECLKRADAPKGLFTLTVPTGGGKTLSGLRFALHHAAHHNMDRIIHVIPFTSIIDQNARVAREILETDDPFGSIVLEHHSNLDPEKETPRTSLAGECWDAPVIFTTMVQFLESLFRGGTRGARRMHRLANAVIIFDEIQTLPLHCAHLFCNAVNFLVQQCGSSVVLCTATQPLLDRIDPNLGALELTPHCEIALDQQCLFEDLKRVEIIDRTRSEGWSDVEIADLAVGEYQRTGSCLVVVNTKKWARTLYEECARRGVAGLCHLSTDMCPTHRLRMLADMRTRLDAGEPVFCVSTQLIEAGVDISFGAAVRFLAGLDSIVQTAGRCNRNGKGPLGQVHIVNPTLEDISMLQAIKTGREVTLRVLSEFRDDPAALGGSLLHPLAMERYFTYAFFHHSKEMTYPVSSRETGHSDTLFNMLSCNPRNPGTMPFQLSLRQSFATAGELFKIIDAPTQGVIVPYEEGKKCIADLCGVFVPQQQSPLLRRAQRYSVNVFPNVLKELQEAKAVHETQKGSGILYLDERYYSQQFGLSTTPVAMLQPQIC